MEKKLFEKNLWVPDTGASSHMCRRSEGFVSINRGEKTIANFENNGNESESKVIGTWKGKSYHQM